MLGASGLSWLGVALLVPPVGARAALFGMLGPLLVAIVAWVVMERTHRSAPERLTTVMATAFGAKMVFFGIYVAVMLKVLAVPLVPFVVSFTSYFIGLYLIEAFCLWRLSAVSKR